MTRNIEDHLPIVAYKGLNTDKAVDLDSTLNVQGAVTLQSTLAVQGVITPTGGMTRLVESVNGDQSLLAGESSKMFVNVKGTTTTTFTLPGAQAGLFYTIVEGDAGGEILVTPATGDAIVTKIHAAENGTALAPAAGTGIKNTAATNVAGDSITLVALDGTTWYGVSLIGLWASQ